MSNVQMCSYLTLDHMIYNYLDIIIVVDWAQLTTQLYNLKMYLVLTKSIPLHKQLNSNFFFYT